MDPVDPANSAKSWQDIASQIVKEEDPQRILELCLTLNNALEHPSPARNIHAEGKPT
jgi:hypothetical protein